MYKTIQFKDKNIAYSIVGQGETIILLHGYLESLHVWESFTEKLKSNYQIIAIDLPGHGNSDLTEEKLTMELMADSVNAVIEELNIEKCFMIGHSMGGYVTMEFVEKYKDKLQGFCLFHSSPFSDSEEKKKIRDRIITSIEQGKKIILAKEHVEKTFATENKDKFIQEKGFLKIIAINTTDQGTISALRAMKTRKNQKINLEKTDLPVLWILGEKDNFISPKITTKLSLPEQIKIEYLKKSGHQGYIEEEEKSVEIIKKFMEKIYKLQ